ncbi:adenosine deaminase [Massilia sp. CF038]|uniref:adenosine deaminase n=1 Tax=Massilia sp. CF038 TaxID=1881045 RepID=UPI00091C8F1E|nr:adenosine deaminase [Massilia sp. CF038]SHH24115.1 adenosine deaminase [Massilia sp. CF038]
MIRQSSRFAVMALALVAGSSAHAAPKSNPNEAATARHFAALIAGAEPKTAELTLFFSQMPKGGDLHHHYSGAIYAEQFISWVDKQGYCINKQSYRIETDKSVVAAERAKAAADRACLSGADTVADDGVYRELLQRWSSKDFYNHGALQAPPDRQFFSTFGYFNPVADSNTNEGLLTLKQRAIEENVSYIETVFKLAPFTPDPAFDTLALKPGMDDGALDAALRAALATLDKDAAFNAQIKAYVDGVQADSAQVDDARFTMRYQPYVLRFFSPSMVFSQMVASFKAARQSPLIVGVNIVGQESANVSMRDYALHMKMFRFLKTVYPEVKLSLHAGELALGDVPPEGLRFHIDQALNVAGASRIGHGLDLAHETNAPAIIKAMRERDVPVEINLTSNGFISGIKEGNHPLAIYRKYKVPYVIATDDAGVTRHTLAQEYVLFASRYKPGYAEVKKAAYNSLRYAFLAEQDKQRLKADLDQRFATFESRIAALDAAAAR